MPIPDSSTTVKIFSLVIILWAIPLVIYRFMLQLDTPPDGVAYMFALMGLGFAVFRMDKMPFWKNALVAILTTSLAIVIGAVGMHLDKFVS